MTLPTPTLTPPPTISLVLTTYDRDPQLASTLDSITRQGFIGQIVVVDDGSDHGHHDRTRAVCLASTPLVANLSYIPLCRPPSAHFRNPSFPNNVGIRAARGEVVILQNAECKHVDPQTIRKLTALVTPTRAVFAHVTALHPDGSPMMDYCSPANPRPYFFCGAIRREILLRLRGYDEDFTGAGYDDDDLADRLAGEGVEFVFSDIAVHHQHHAPAGDYSSSTEMRLLYQSKLSAMLRGELGTVRNVGRPWGGQP